jgi:hypothetical protein
MASAAFLAHDPAACSRREAARFNARVIAYKAFKNEQARLHRDKAGSKAERREIDSAARRVQQAVLKRAYAEALRHWRVIPRLKCTTDPLTNPVDVTAGDLRYPHKV